MFLLELFFGRKECEEIVRSFPSSFRLVPHNVNRISPTMWPECEENVSMNEDAYCEKHKYIAKGLFSTSTKLTQHGRNLSYEMAMTFWKFSQF